MCMKIMSSENKITPKEIRYTMVGCTYSEINKLKPDASWLSNKTWINICETVDNFQVFNGLDDAFMENPDEWEIIHQS